MHRKMLAIIVGAALVGCASTPPPVPVPDEATRRPVNTGLGIELQGCQANLANTRLELEETVRNAGRTGSSMAQLAAHCDADTSPKQVMGKPGSVGAAGPTANGVYILFFRYAEHEIRLTDEEIDRLVADARTASAIQVRGRTDGTRDNSFDNALAARRAHAVFALLVEHGVDPNRIRLTYQGYGDGISPNTDEKTRALNRRAEIEIYRQLPDVVVFASHETK